MDSNTLEALRAAIQHWRDNVAADTPDKVETGPDACPLCALFYKNLLCDGCPVASVTGQCGCAGTPYGDAEEAHEEWVAMPRNIVVQREFRERAQAEVDFLISLLPPEDSAAAKKERV